MSNTRTSCDQTIRFLKCNLRISSVDIKTSAYTTYVLPKAEYASTVWDPHTKSNREKVEIIQHNAARWVLEWRSLELCCADSRLSMLYKIQNDMVPITLKCLSPVSDIARCVAPHKLYTLSKQNTD